MWYLLTGGLSAVWHGAWRWGAVAVMLVLAAAVWPEYRLTRARRRRGLPPYSWAVAIAGPLGWVQTRAAAIWDAHQRERAPRAEPGLESAPERPIGTEPPRRRRRGSPARWIVALVMVAGSWVLWQVMVAHEDRTEESTYGLSYYFQWWRDVEDWADVPDDRRAAPGPALDADGHAPMIVLVRTRRRTHTVRVTVRCPSRTTVCRGDVRIRDAHGEELDRQRVRVEPRRRTTIAVVLDRHSAAHANVSIVEAL